MRASSLAAITGLALLASASAAVAQTDDASIALAGGYVDHAVAGGTTGTAFGFDASFPASGATVRVGYRRMILEGDAPDTDVLRAVGRYPALEAAGVLASAEVHGGVARFTLGDDSGIVLVGGVGLHITPDGPAPIRPYLSVRALGGYTTGTVLGTTYDGGGLSLGVEGGLEAGLGPLLVRVSATRDGFDGGLGATPYPKTSGELSVGFHF